MPYCTVFVEHLIKLMNEHKDKKRACLRDNTVAASLHTYALNDVFADPERPFDKKILVVDMDKVRSYRLC